MYRIRPYTADFLVEPAKIIYNLPCHHQSDISDAVNQAREFNFQKICAQKISSIENGKEDRMDGSNTQEINGTISSSDLMKTPSTYDKEAENTHEALVKQLLSLSKRLDKFIAEEKNIKQSQTPVKNVSSPAKSIQRSHTINNSQQSKEPKESTKKEDKKAAKKAERKEKREAIKGNNNVSIVSKSVEGEKSKAPISEKQSGPQFAFKTPHINSPDLINANIQPTDSVFPIHNYGSEAVLKIYKGKKIYMMVRDIDKAWVKLLSKIGLKKGVKIVDKWMPTDVSKHLLLIVVTYGGSEVRIASDESHIDLVGELAIWKFIGSLLDCYSSQDALVSVKTDKWLLMAIVNELDSLSRQLGSFLGANNFLSSQHAICLADLILRSLFPNQQNGDLTPWKEVKTANNVQLWLKRIDDALNAFE